MTEEATIYIEGCVIDDANKLLSEGDPDRQKGVIQKWTANFGNGYEAEIKLCGGDPPYIDAILFHNGNEASVLEADSETLDGEYIFWVQHPGDEEDMEFCLSIERGENSTPLIAILEANKINPEQMVPSDDGPAQTALQVLEGFIGEALDRIEGTEDAQISE